jgi:transcriptional regulator of acetoin/glycerol metabolism
MSESEIIPLAEVVQKAVVAAVEYTRGNKREAAAFLRISRSTLYRILANEQARNK